MATLSSLFLENCSYGKVTSGLYFFLLAAAVAFFIQSKRQNMSHFVIEEDYQTN